ncbi:transcriptional regulator swi6 [Nowakowskiella sp. JEL0407]|nr:transcriptional regulator swi6 [Nowakowskiella sp. JEL0407]
MQTIDELLAQHYKQTTNPMQSSGIVESSKVNQSRPTSQSNLNAIPFSIQTPNIQAPTSQHSNLGFSSSISGNHFSSLVGEIPTDVPRPVPPSNNISPSSSNQSPAQPRSLMGDSPPRPQIPNHQTFMQFSPPRGSQPPDLASLFRSSPQQTPTFTQTVIPPPPRAHIYSAVYSGIPVYELMCRNVAVMRRRSDSYLNATQILKVAGIDKGKRTKILEREIMTGEHEKVQGGYGKYQGTWVPFERAVQLAIQYGVDAYIRPLFEFERPPGSQNALLLLDQSTSVAPVSTPVDHPMEDVEPAPPKPPRKRKPKATGEDIPMKVPKSTKKAAKSTALTAKSTPKATTPDYPALPETSFEPEQELTEAEINRATLMSMFLRVGFVPDFLTSDRPSTIDLDMVIDELGNASIHWAAALAKTYILRLILQKGANPGLVNLAGETALIRAVLATNGYDNLNFPETIKLLCLTIPHADAKGRTVLHHIAFTTNSKTRVDSAKYYMEVVLECIAKHGVLFADVIDKKDRNGDTALNIAGRNGCKAMIEMLLDVGAADMENNVGLKLEDYGFGDLVRNHQAATNMEEIDPKVASAAEALLMHRRHGIPMTSNGSGSSASFETNTKIKLKTINSSLEHRNKEAAQVAMTLIENMNEATHMEMSEQQRVLEEKQTQLSQIVRSAAETRKQITMLRKENENLPNVTQRVRELENMLREGNIAPLSPYSNPPNGGEQEGFQPETLQSEVQALRAQLATREAELKALKHELFALKSSSGQYETQCKKIIAACCDINEDEVELMLEPLLNAVESDPGNLDVSSIAEFMSRVKQDEAVRG